MAAVNGSVLVGVWKAPAGYAAVPGGVFIANTAIPLFGRARLSIDGQRDVGVAATEAESLAAC